MRSMATASVRLAASLFHRSTAAAACVEFAAERRAGRKCRSTTAGLAAMAFSSAAHAGSVVLTARDEAAVTYP